MLLKKDITTGVVHSAFFSTAKILTGGFNPNTSPAYIRMILMHSEFPNYANGVALLTGGEGQPDAESVSESNVAKHENGNLLNVGDVISEEFTPITFVNDSTAGKVFVHLGNEPVAEIGVCDNSSWSMKHMWLMGSAQVSSSLSYSQDYMSRAELKDVVLYAGTKTRQQCLDINKYLYRRANG